MKISYHSLFDAVHLGTSEKNEVIIENSKHGTNYEVYDLFYEYKDIFVIAEDIKKNKETDSYDRILTISKKTSVHTDGNKSSMMFIVSHNPGSLYRALAVFENYELNLTKIESRKMYDKSYTYMFYVDFEYSAEHQKKIDEIIAVYKENTEYLRIIGYYKSASL